MGRSGAASRRTRWLAAAFAVAAVWAGAPAALAAQEINWASPPLHRLTAAELDALLPHLEAQADWWDAARSAGPARSAAITGGFNEYEAYMARWEGGDDPLPFLKGLGDLPLPPGATYAEACSRGVTTLAAEPIAIFTLGIPAAEIELADAGQSTWQPQRPGDMGPGWERVDSVQKAGEYFYASRGWSLESSILTAPGGRLSVEVQTMNSGARYTRSDRPRYTVDPELDRVLARVHAACVAAGWGPVLRVSAPDEVPRMVGSRDSDEPDDPGPPILPAQLENAFFQLVSAANNHDEGLTAEDLAERLEGIRAYAETEPDAVVELEIERIRQANLALYRRHPLRDRLHAVIGRLYGR